jgi:5-methyltetrahydrofolate--homocysteine methyltransferase
MRCKLSSRGQAIEIGPDVPFVLIGERINPTGRKKLGAQMAAGDFSAVRRDAEAQVAAGARMLDVNAGYPMGDEIAMLRDAVRAVQAVCDAPLCLDSSRVDALEAALAVYEGKALVNSVTAEEERLRAILPEVRKYNAAVIGVVSDESGIPVGARERLAVARKIVARARAYGIADEDVILDPICLPVAVDPHSAGVTLETIRLIREELAANTCCGASNVAFGLLERAGLSAAFLAMAIECGLTAAIADVRNPVVPDLVLAAQVLIGRDEYAARWLAHSREKLKLGAELARVG